MVPLGQIDLEHCGTWSPGGFLSVGCMTWDIVTWSPGRWTMWTSPNRLVVPQCQVMRGAEGATEGNYNQPLITYHILPIRIQCKTCLTQMPSYVDSGSKEWMGRIRDLETRANTNSNMQPQLGRSINAPLAKSASIHLRNSRHDLELSHIVTRSGVTKCVLWTSMMGVSSLGYQLAR